MSAIFQNIDPGGLLEYSVVFTDRSLNHMSKNFQNAMNDISTGLKKVYNAESVVVIPGGGTFGMESIARQFALNKKCLIVRNGWFSFRWSEIIEQCNLSNDVTVVKAKKNNDNFQASFAPPDINELTKKILKEKPQVVFAPHVETSAGMVLPDDYLFKISEAIHSVNGIFVLDCVASGALWVDMKKSGVDVLLSAPQKGWSSTPSSGLVMLSEKAKKIANDTESNSYVCNLKKWLTIMKTYEDGAHSYHTTMPTDSLVNFRNTLLETEKHGFEKIKNDQIFLGKQIRNLLESKGFKSVAAEGFQSTSVVVSYTDNPNIKSGKAFIEQGLQIAAGIPLELDEGEDFLSFRIGLFGLDKLLNPKRTVDNLEKALCKLN